MDSTSQATRIYRAIKDSGEQGIENWKLVKIALNYTMRISELRKDGHIVIAERVYANGRWTGTFKYRLGDKEERVIKKSSLLDRIRTATIGV